MANLWRQTTWTDNKAVRVISVFIILATLAAGLVVNWGTGHVQAADFAAGDSVMVDTDLLNLRTSAGLSHTVIDVLESGTALVVTAGPNTADGYNWYEVRTKVGTTGWVAGEFLEFVRSWARFTPGELVAVDTPRLNCRSGPGLNNDVIHIMDSGTEVTILDGPTAANGYHWYKVQTGNGDAGWVIGESLDVAGGVPGAVFGKGDQVVVDTDYLNRRTGAGLSYTVIDVLESGTPLFVSNDPKAVDGHVWYEVETRDGQTGWVSGDYLAPAPGLGFAVGDAVRVANGAQNLREGPGKDAAVIRVMANSELLQVRGGPVNVGAYTWYRVWNYSGEGWAAGEFLRLDPNGWPEEGGA